MHVALLADCGPGVGLGHVRRSAVLAKAFAAKGWTAEMLVPSPDGNAVSAAAGLSARPWEPAMPLAARIVVIDGYTFDASVYDAARRAGSFVVAIDDLAERPVPCDAVLNHNLYASALDYSRYGAAKVLAGPTFALIDPAFASLVKTRTPRAAPRVLVFFGGADDGRYGVPAAIAVLETVADAVVDLVLVPATAQATILPSPQGGGEQRGALPNPIAMTLTAADAAVQRFPDRLKVHRGADMPRVMATATHYVGGGGVTVMEALSAGLEVIVCAVADNQRHNIRWLAEIGFAAFERFDATAMAAAVARPAGVLVRDVATLLDGTGADRAVAMIETGELRDRLDRKHGPLQT